ncbi:hypothetical protein L5B97_11405 [Avibacterium sp. 20-15]|uniref:hypothetical protein n=1 Tax=unclassified Avibacterium TaxID=2685287 RepID=UPI0020261627|nr:MULTISPECIES: hypothetical protein [unclassified Avibacterium]MCW9734062.1 hypothetical protein [Avibacterium sp. 20-15]URL03709.1 hypothetical protein L4F93_09060 [Avibacterium sp. 20-132]
MKKTIGTLQDKDKNSNTLHIEDSYALTIGFEIIDFEKNFIDLGNLYGNTDKYHYAVKSPGHTFIYLSYNNEITSFFSLGPEASNNGNNGSYLKKMHGKGTPDYWISDDVYLFRFHLEPDEYIKLLEKITRERESILNGEKYYRVVGNHTCASAARDIITSIWSNFPKGESKIVLIGDREGIEFVYPISVVNPYAFYNDLVKGGYKYRKIDSNINMWDLIIRGEDRNDPYINTGEK